MNLEWDYSRNQRRHTAFDKYGHEVFWIRTCAPYRTKQGKYGYRLSLPDGGHVQFSKTVKILKMAAESRHIKS